MQPIKRSLAALALVVVCAAPALADRGRSGPRPGDGPGGIAAAGRYLELTEEQAASWRTILEQSREAIRVIAEQLRVKQQALAALLETPNPDPVAVGALTLEIRALRQQIRTAEAAVGTSLEATLTPAQEAKLAAVQAAAPLCRLVPAFAQLHLISRPDPPAQP